MSATDDLAATDRVATPPAVRGSGLTLAVVLLAVFVVPSSISGTAVALPAIGADLDSGVAGLQWVVNAFNLAFACFTLAWGSIADIIGRARAFAAGAALYLVASVISAVAGNIYLIDAGRALAGIGGAAIFAAGGAILSTIFTGTQRARAFGLFGAVAGIGVALGPSLSGVIVEGLGWRWIFGLHVIVLAVALLGSPAVFRAVGGVRRQASVDFAGAGLFILAMLALMIGIVQGGEWGWTSTAVLGSFAAFVVLLAVFTAVQRRVAHPMLDLSVLRDRRFVGVSLVTVVASFGFVTMLTYLPSYLTTVGGTSTALAGVLMVLLTAGVLVCPLAAGKLVSRGVSPLTLIYVSLACLVAGDAAATVFGPSFSVGVVVLPLLVIGAGMGISTGLVDGQALDAVPAEKAGMAAGVVNTMRLGSEAIAVAVYGALLAAILRSTLTTGLPAFGAADPVRVAGDLATGNLAAAARTAGGGAGVTDFLVRSYDDAFHTILWVLTGICLVLSLVIVALLRKPARVVA
ncbi:MFS transporter [Amycolatopsis sp. NBC_01307]|uniref:MFS transporter n=1 Tax=Amycolatopsis sp. NBC_01307 TaxID=2903561 RepID=UPI002E108E68|nr:MFS transporter [Amycolatopsis sp. NBC_01307]